MRMSALLIGLSVLAACGRPVTDAERWSRAWMPPTPEVTRALVLNGIRGCGEFYQKESTVMSGDFCGRVQEHA
jgi:hypothetical protein